ncbi:asparagine synthase [Thozetella sp. PMI_491]|nr:asparagine synthase [Thozetella sp. PMI_491]
MCGITASITLGTTSRAKQDTSDGITNLTTQLEKSLDFIAHRGPDARGVWVSEDCHVGLAHCRLSINDLSSQGDQPIHSDDGQIHAVVNGEIYDHIRLREHLSRDHGYNFCGHSDSELVVALYKVHGAPKFLEHIRGEFAFVLYDEPAGKILVVRDRFGIKPLFWTTTDQTIERLLIAAEAKALLAFDWKPRWDLGCLADGGWIHDDRTLFRGLKKVPPGCFLEVLNDGKVYQHRYWDLDYRNKCRTIDEMVVGVREHLMEAVKLRLQADVPVGIYLSGGIDSSLIAGIATTLVREQGVKMGDQEAAKRISCFCVEYSQPGFNESAIAERTAEWLGIQLDKVHIDEEQLANNFADAAYHCEHHNADLNSVSKFALSELARDKNYKVVLTGEGADEHFAGYRFFAPDLLRESDLALPDAPLTRDPPKREEMLKMVEEQLSSIYPRSGAFQHSLGESATTRSVNGSSILTWMLGQQPTQHVFAPWVREQPAYTELDCRDTALNSLSVDAREKILNKWHPLHSAEYITTKTMLANVMLSCLGDRTEMAHSIEARPPFLDHHLSEFACGLPPSVNMAFLTAGEKLSSQDSNPWKTGRAVGNDTLTEKWILREAGRPFVTQEVYERPKLPFFAPIAWPRDGALHRMFRTMLTEEAVERLGFVDFAVVKNSLENAFGDQAKPLSFRVLLVVGAWVTIGQRFDIPRATLNDLDIGKGCPPQSSTLLAEYS